MLIPKDGPSWTDNTLNAWGTPVAKETQKRSWASRLKISLWAAQGVWSICSVMDVSSPESSSGGEGLFLSVRMCLLLLSPLHSSNVSVTEVCPAARPHVRRILSLSINWSLNPHTPTPYLQRQLHNGTRISGLLEVYFPHILILLPSLFYPFPQTHILSSLDTYLKHTFGVKHTNQVHTDNKGCCLICCVPEASLASRLCPSGLWLKWIRHLCWHIWTDHSRSLLPPCWRDALLQSTVHRRLSDVIVFTHCAQDELLNSYIG